MPADSFGREINYLRISLTSRCNLRCVYCMPEGAAELSPYQELITPEEIELVARAAVAVGFRKVRLTGGEPTLRSDLIEIVERLTGVKGLHDISMTTNGILLPKLARPLKKAGLRRVNVHLDTLHRQRLPKLMRLATAGRIWAGIEAAQEAGFRPVKLNAVVTRGFNENDTIDLASLTIRRPWHVRFIELMPIGAGQCANLARSNYFSNQETKRVIEQALGPLTPIAPDDPSQDSRNYRLPQALGVVGFISPVSEPFCQSCNRMRITSHRRFHLCLLNPDEIDATSALRGRNLTVLQNLLLEAVRRKPTGEAITASPQSIQRQMYQIGG